MHWDRCILSDNAYIGGELGKSGLLDKEKIKRKGVTLWSTLVDPKLL